MMMMMVMVIMMKYNSRPYMSLVDRERVKMSKLTIFAVASIEAVETVTLVVAGGWHFLTRAAVLTDHARTHSRWHNRQFLDNVTQRAISAQTHH